MTHEFFEGEKTLKVFISGQKYFGGLILREMVNNPMVEVVAYAAQSVTRILEGPHQYTAYR
jgi:hypothetical protein